MDKLKAGSETLDPQSGHNAGPPLDEDEGPPWGNGDPYLYFCWDRAWKQTWKQVPYEIMMLRQDRAEALGLTYEEYTLEILERGRHLQVGDERRLKAIKRARNWR